MSRTRLASIAIVSLSLTALQPAMEALAASAIVITAISPRSGPIGSQVTLTGSGFLADNTVLFGSGGVFHVRSDDGAKLVFAVPAALNPPCFEQGCRILSQFAQPGIYKVSVRNENGVSNAVSFTLRFE